MHARPFLIGLLCGAVAAAVPMMLSSGAAGPLRGGDPLDPGRAEPSTVDGADPRSGATAEIARLRAELEALRAAASRQPLDGAADAGSDAGAAPVPAVVPRDRRTDALLAELDEMLRTGVLAALCQESIDSVVQFLLQTWVETDRPERALSLIQRLDLVAEAGGYGSWLGGQLLARGDKDLALQAFAFGLRADPTDWEAVMRLAELDPAAALRLRAELQPDGNADPAFRSQTALLLLADGQRDAALREIRALIDEGMLAEPVWQALVEREPELATEHLRTRLAATAPDEQLGLQLQLAAALRNQGNRDEARRELETALTRWPDDGSVLTALAELDPGGALGWLQRRTREAPSPTAWGLYGDRLMQAERNEEAIAAFHQASELAPGAGYEYRLLELAPERYATRLAERAAAAGDDEMFGDIADACWRSGRQAEAIAYWRRALELDPSDGEWQNKVRAVDSGRDPLR